MKLIVLIASYFLVACSTGHYSQKETNKLNNKQDYILSDQTGNYRVTREIKVKSNKLVSRVQILDVNMNKTLESSVAVSRIGYFANDKKKAIALFPEASQFKVWFNKKEYSSRARIDKKSRELYVSVVGDDKIKGGTKKIKVPSSKAYCYFSQLPECVKIQGMLFEGRNKKRSLYVIWDNFPFHTELYNAVGASPYVLADFYLESKTKNEYKYSLDIGNQIIFYHFDSKFNFDKMFWISQGISLIKK